MDTYIYILIIFFLAGQLAIGKAVGAVVIVGAEVDPWDCCQGEPHQLVKDWWLAEED